MSTLAVLALCHPVLLFGVPIVFAVLVWINERRLREIMP